MSMIAYGNPYGGPVVQNQVNAQAGGYPNVTIANNINSGSPFPFWQPPAYPQASAYPSYPTQPPAYPTTPSYPPAAAEPTAPISQYPNPTILLAPQQPPQHNQKEDETTLLVLILALFSRQRSEDRYVERDREPVTVEVEPERRRVVERKPVTIDTTEFQGEVNALPKSPLAFDLNGDGVQTSDEKVQYDIDGDGKIDTINNISAGDGILSFDGDGDGVSGSTGKELLGDNTDLDGDGKADGFKDGFQALKALAEEAKRQGLINQDDHLDAQEILTLEQVYGLKMKTGSLDSEAVSLVRDLGIKGIDLSDGAKTRVNNFDGRGNDTIRQDGASFIREDGSRGGYEDIFFKLHNQVA